MAPRLTDTYLLPTYLYSQPVRIFHNFSSEIKKLHELESGKTRGCEGTFCKTDNIQMDRTSGQSKNKLRLSNLSIITVSSIISL